MTLGRASIGTAALLLVACGEGTAQRGSLPMELEQGEAPTAPTTSTTTPPTTNVAGGETSEFSGGSIPGGCPCALRSPLRATVTALGEETVRVRVEELLGATANAEVGSEIEGGLWYGGLPCMVGRVDVAVGDEVLAFYWPSQTCVMSSGVECSAGPASPSRIVLTHWGQTLLLADATRDLTISIDDLPLLDAPEAECRAALGDLIDYIGPDDVGLP